MVPVAGSAYTYSYAVMGEMVAWTVGWALMLEYALGASAVAVGWSGHMVGFLNDWGVHIPHALTSGAAHIARSLSARRRGGRLDQPASRPDQPVRDSASDHRHQGKRDVQRRPGGGEDRRP